MSSNVDTALETGLKPRDSDDSEEGQGNDMSLQDSAFSLDEEEKVVEEDADRLDESENEHDLENSDAGGDTDDTDEQETDGMESDSEIKCGSDAPPRKRLKKQKRRWKRIRNPLEESDSDDSEEEEKRNDTSLLDIALSCDDEEKGIEEDADKDDESENEHDWENSDGDDTDEQETDAMESDSGIKCGSDAPPRKRLKKQKRRWKRIQNTLEESGKLIDYNKKSRQPFLSKNGWRWL
ncbi:pheromone-processing carboxypeptidase KEX1-like [Patiria miniata]|uniref:Uncharacterized protein n=1 Tax=Patiria miniata TaxID=46514 RepID=A0A914ACW8_PATMI|nr:pheromone-processing carboxypeptidase KEX1-like [Patiria miniata]